MRGSLSMTKTINYIDLQLQNKLAEIQCFFNPLDSVCERVNCEKVDSYKFAPIEILKKAFVSIAPLFGLQISSLDICAPRREKIAELLEKDPIFKKICETRDPVKPGEACDIKQRCFESRPFIQFMKLVEAALAGALELPFQIASTGSYSDEKTVAAVRLLQKKYKIGTGDGRLGPGTLKKLVILNRYTRDSLTDTLVKDAEHLRKVRGSFQFGDSNQPKVEKHVAEALIWLGVLDPSVDLSQYWGNRKVLDALINITGRESAVVRAEDIDLLVKYIQRQPKMVSVN